MRSFRTWYVRNAHQEPFCTTKCIFSVREMAYLNQIREGGQRRNLTTLPPISKGVGVSLTEVDLKWPVMYSIKSMYYINVCIRKINMNRGGVVVERKCASMMPRRPGLESHLLFNFFKNQPSKQFQIRRVCKKDRNRGSVMEKITEA